MTGKSDDALLSGLQAGDEASLRELFLRYYEALCRFAQGLARQRETAEEVVSRVYEDLWRRRGEIQIRTSVKAWLYGAVRLQALDRVRTAARQPTVPLDELGRELEDHESARAALLREETQREVERLLATLPPQRQLVFRLNRLDGLRYREIAEVLHVSEKTVQNHMVLATRQLATALPGIRELICS
ncbi:MAG TPA: sigma-70 family RNA polymerase sigma factor [Opitutus sp.]|nr:sigma-70 family RNA polymerase sigma factor [Opitutus sp.]